MPGRIELEQTGAGHGAVELPTKPAEHVVALAKIRIVRARHLADDPAFHDRTNLDRSGIGARCAHAAAHIGIERKVDAAHERLAVGGIGDRRVDDLEIIAGRRAARPPFQQYLPVLVFHAASPREATA